MGEGSICLVPLIESLAGPGSFQLKLKSAFEKRGYSVHHNPQEAGTRAILIIGGTRHVREIWSAKRRGVRVVNRLNGINWVQRRRFLGLRYAIKAEASNLLLAYTRRFLADHVVYQSSFTRDWWHRWYGEHPGPYSVIHNGVNLTAYSPVGEERPPADHIRLQIVEGHLNLDNRMALENAVAFARALEKEAGTRVELVVVADVLPEVREVLRKVSGDTWVTYTGTVPREQIPSLSRSAHLQFSAEINASCPNSVIEALACGLPVAAFDSGALPELVSGDAGVVVPYGADPWKLERPDAAGLARAALPLLADQERYRRGARTLAVEKFDLEQMADRYLEALLGTASS